MGKSAWCATASAAVMISLAGGPAALAQDRSANNAVGVELSDVVVTARRVAERLQDVPVSVTVLNSEQIAQQNIVNGADLTQRIPSLQANYTLGTANTTFALRGFTQETGTPAAVGVYFADVVAPRGFATTIPSGDGAGSGAFFDLQNVQVLKGPQGTLFGRNTTGGAILLVPQRPTDAFEGYIEGSVGNYDMRRLQGVVNLPLGEKARLRIGADVHKRDGYLRNTTGVGPSRFNDINYVAARASLVVDLTPDLENYTVFSYTDVDQHGDLQQIFEVNPAVLPFGLLARDQLQRSIAQGNGFYTVQNGVPNAALRNKTWQIINTTTWQASDNLTVKNIASYGKLEQFFSGGPFGTYADLSSINGFLAGIGRAPVPAGTFVRIVGGVFPFSDLSHNQETMTEEFRIEGKALDGRLDFQSGVYLELSRPHGLNGTGSQNFVVCSSLYVCANPSGFGTTSINAQKASFRNVGVYSQASYHLTDQLTLTGGIRYTWDKMRSIGVAPRYAFPISNNQTPFNAITCGLPAQTPPSCVVLGEQKTKAPTWVLSLDYKPTPDLLTYAKWSRGYRAGGITAQAPPPIDKFDKEKLDTYEVGLKFSSRGSVPVNLNLAAFYNDFRGQLIVAQLIPTTPGLSPQAASINTGKSRIYGLEAEGSIQPFEGFTISGGYAYLNTKIKEVETPVIPAGFPYSFQSSARPGDELVTTPKHKVAVTAQYRLPLDDSIGDISVAATLIHTGKMGANYVVRDAAGRLTGTSVLPSRDIVDLNIDWKRVADRPINLSFFATNVTNKKYSLANLNASFMIGRQIAPPRMYGVRLRYMFGE